MDEDDVGEYKASKKRRGKKLDDPDFMVRSFQFRVDEVLRFLQPMRYIKVNEVPKVIQALRQNSSPKMVYKLLTRIKVRQSSLKYISVRLQHLCRSQRILQFYGKLCGCVD